MKRAAALRLRKYREQQRAFLVEGADPVIAGILSGARPQVVFVLADGPAARSLKQAAADEGGAGGAAAQAAGGTAAGSAGSAGGEAAEAAGGAAGAAAGLAGLLAGVHVQPLTERVAQKISTLGTPPDVMAVFDTLTPPPLSTLDGAGALVLYVDHVADPGNLGTLLRSALAFGATALATSPGCVDPFSPKVVRAAMGAVFGLPVYPEALVVDISRGLGGATVYGLAAHGGTDLRNLELRRPAVVCVGAERAGLSPEVAALCDELVTIPLPGAVPGGPSEAGAAVESLNAGVAGSIALYELSRRTAGGTKR